MKIRSAQINDLEAITAIYRDAVLNGTASFELRPPDLAEMTARFNKICTSGYPWLVAEHDETILGYAYAGAYHLRPAYRWCVEDSIYIDPAHHGKGIGKALLGKLLSSCQSAGFRQMIAVIGDSQNLGSIHLHRSLGFDTIGTIKNVGHKHGKWLNIVLMQMSLGEGETTAPDQNTYPGTLFKPS